CPTGGGADHTPIPLDNTDEGPGACHRLVLGGPDARVDDRGDVLHRFVETILDDGFEQLFLAVEVRVHRTFGESRFLGDLVQRGGDVSAPGEDRGGGVDELSAGSCLLLFESQPFWRLLLRLRVRLPRPARARGPSGLRASCEAKRGDARSPAAATARPGPPACRSP